MSDTHPNAYRAEAAEKRQQIAQLAAEANALEEQANALEGTSSVVESTPVETPTEESSDRKLFKK